MPSKTPSKKSPRRTNTRKAKSVSPKTNLWSKFSSAIFNGDLNTVKRLVRMGVFEQPIDKKKCDQLAKLAISLFLRSRNEREKQRRIKIFDILARETELFDFTPNNVNNNMFSHSWKTPSMFTTLIDQGFDVNTQDDEGNTILIVVVTSAIFQEEGVNFNQNQYTRLINQLFEIGADINIQNHFGLDAIMVAGGHPGVGDYFGVDTRPNIHYFELLLDNLQERKIRYKINENKTAEVNDARADEYTLMEILDYIHDNMVHNDQEEVRNNREYIEARRLFKAYELSMRKPIKSATKTDRE
tara:strand:- start:2100 stop:2996 length:897 start_codon:yes stop_codon:yes gene_type:complete